MTDLYIMTHLAKIVATGNTNRSMYLTAGSYALLSLITNS